MDNFITITVITTGEDLVDRFNVNSPLKVVFNRALEAVGGGKNRDQFSLEYQDRELNLDLKIKDAITQFDWGNEVELELVPRPEVI